MSGARLTILTVALAASLVTSAARAADYQQPPPQVFVQPPQVVESYTDGWYLRGFVGVGMSTNFQLDYLPSPGNVGNGFVFQHNSSSDTTFVGGGFGYEFNNWLRFDFTGEYARRRSMPSGLIPSTGSISTRDTSNPGFS